MTPEERDLSRLLVEVSRHYTRRGFDPHAISVLRSTIIFNTKGGTFALHNAMQNFESSIASLLDHFSEPSGKCPKADLRASNAIFAFSFGYQLENFKDPAPINRRPGKNNTQLAKIAASLEQKYEKPLFAQFEIADAPALSGVKMTACQATFEKSTMYESTKEDMGTKEVISQFMAIAKSQKIKTNSVIVVAHGHHIERCIRLLIKYFGVTGLTPSAQPYYGYDPDECQPRAMSAEDYIVSDFISMAAMTKDVIVDRAVRCKQ